jgi:A/G-specific adenine glycosylase
VGNLPLKSKKLLKKNRYFYYFVWKSPEGFTFIKKRNEKDIWNGLYDFPLFEHSTELKENDISKLWESDTWKNLVSTDSKVEFLVNFSTTYFQVLTHQKIFAIFVEVFGDLPQLNNEEKFYQIIPLSDLKQLALPKTIQKYLETDLFPKG